MTDKETIKHLRAEVTEQQHRIDKMRESAWMLADERDRWKREATLKADISGPAYRHPMYCSDGRVWARDAVESREDTIRFFAAQAVAGTMSVQNDVNSAPPLAAAVAYALWDLLEDIFHDERAKRKAEAETEPPESDGAE